MISKLTISNDPPSISARDDSLIEMAERLPPLVRALTW